MPTIDILAFALAAGVIGCLIAGGVICWRDCRKRDSADKPSVKPEVYGGSGEE